MEKEISQLEQQIQTRESIIKNLSSANEKLSKENSEVRKKLKSDQATSEKAKNCTGAIQPITAKNDSRNNQRKGKPSMFIADDSMACDLKGWLMSRDTVKTRIKEPPFFRMRLAKVLKLQSFDRTFCSDIRYGE